MSLPSSPEALQIRARHFAGLFLLSLATLLLELALTRILSVSLWYHFGFLVISTALLGFGVSGITLALWAGLRERKDLDLGLGICGLAFAVCVVFSFWCMQRIPLDFFGGRGTQTVLLHATLFPSGGSPILLFGLGHFLFVDSGVKGDQPVVCLRFVGSRRWLCPSRSGHSTIWRKRKRPGSSLHRGVVSRVFCPEMQPHAHNDGLLHLACASGC